VSACFLVMLPPPPPRVQALSINFATGAIKDASRDAIKLAHGALMFISWGVMLPLGIFMARFAKRVKPNVRVFFCLPCSAAPQGARVLCGSVRVFVAFGSVMGWWRWWLLLLLLMMMLLMLRGWRWRLWCGDVW
jgi:hypothetical protein